MPGGLAAFLRDAPLSQQKVAVAWKASVGPGISRITAVRLEGTRLLVDAQSPEWAREVRKISSIILDRMQTLLGRETIDSIEVRS
jgi:hypothetical protein